MKLTPRLQSIADLVDKGSVVGDVGSDHGYIPIYLIERGICEKTIASDINQGPVDNAKKSVSEYGFHDAVSVRLGGGLVPYTPKEIDTVIIAGMGGLLIRDIMLESPKMVETIDTFILQPMVAQDELRQWLYENEYTIEKEILSQEGDKFYEVLYVKKGKMDKYTKLELEIGKNMVKHDDMSRAFIKKKIRKYETIVENIESNGAENNQDKLKDLYKRLDKLKEVFKCL